MNHQVCPSWTKRIKNNIIEFSSVINSISDTIELDVNEIESYNIDYALQLIDMQFKEIRMASKKKAIFVKYMNS